MRNRASLNETNIRPVGGFLLLLGCLAGAFSMLKPLLEIERGGTVIGYSPEGVGLTVVTFALGFLFLIFGMRLEDLFGRRWRTTWGIALIVILLASAVSASYLFEAYLKSLGVYVVTMPPIPTFPF